MQEKINIIINIFFRNKSKLISNRERAVFLFSIVYTVVFISRKEIVEKLFVFLMIIFSPFFKITEKTNLFIKDKQSKYQFLKEYSNDIDLLIQENAELKKEINEYKSIDKFFEKRRSFKVEIKEHLINENNLIKVFGRKDHYIFAQYKETDSPSIGDLIINESLFLIGKVVNVDKFFRVIRVQLAEDKNSNIPVFIEKLNVQGFINPDLKESSEGCNLIFEIEDYDKNKEEIVKNIKDQMHVFTSNVDNIVESDIQIGYIKKINNIICVEREINYNNNRYFTLKNRYKAFIE